MGTLKTREEWKVRGQVYSELSGRPAGEGPLPEVKLPLVSAEHTLRIVAPTLEGAVEIARAAMRFLAECEHMEWRGVPEDIGRLAVRFFDVGHVGPIYDVETEAEAAVLGIAEDPWTLVGRALAAVDKVVVNDAPGTDPVFQLCPGTMENRDALRRALGGSL